jgi:hypothetical protein
MSSTFCRNNPALNPAPTNGSNFAIKKTLQMTAFVSAYHEFVTARIRAFGGTLIAKLTEGRCGYRGSISATR